MKLSANVKEAIEAYNNIRQSIEETETARSNLSHKQTLLTKEIEEIDQQMSSLKASRPKLLEAVLEGSQPEVELTNQEVTSNQLQVERKSKQDLVELIGEQIEAKNSASVNLNASVHQRRKQVFTAIEKDLVESMPSGCLEHLTRLHIAATASGKTASMVLEDLLPKTDHNGWEKMRQKLLDEYGISE